jgi:integrase
VAQASPEGAEGAHPRATERLFQALRPDHHAIVKFALLTGCRIAECVGLRWRDVDWGGRVIHISRETAKGGKQDTIPLPPSVREVLWPLQGHHPEAVFCYALRHPGMGRVGERRPIAYEGLTSEMQRALAKAGIRDFSFHDLRHTAATRVLRATGNMRVVQRMLRHENIKTTVKYAHAQADDVLAGMEAAAQTAQRVPTNSPHSDAPDQAKGNA